MRKREVEAEVGRLVRRNESLSHRIYEQEALLVRERGEVLDRIERLHNAHARQIETLLTFITTPEQAALLARARELEQATDELPSPIGGGGPDDEPTIGELQRLGREAARRVDEELRARGIDAEEIESAQASS